MRLVLIQNHCSPDRNENLERALNSMEQAKQSGAHMVVFPELAIDRLFPRYEEWNAREIAEPVSGPPRGRSAPRRSRTRVFTKRPITTRATTARACTTRPSAAWRRPEPRRPVSFGAAYLEPRRADSRGPRQWLRQLFRNPVTQPLGTSNPWFYGAPTPSLRSGVPARMLA